MDELIKNLNEVLAKSKDGFTCYWVGQAIAKLSAASPQVVADERKAFEAHITDNGAWPRAAERSVDGGYRLMATAVAWNTWRAATDSFVSRSATPVQEQVAGKPCPYCGSTDGAHDKAYPHPRAPVQPVAVPDEEEFGFKAVRLRRTAFLLGLEGAIPDNDKDLMDCMGAVLGMICREVERISAPAAQGDAWLEKCEALIDIWDDGNKPEDERAYFSGAFPEMLEEIRAAIAAKAAS